MGYTASLAEGRRRIQSFIQKRAFRKYDGAFARTAVYWTVSKPRRL